MKKSLSLLLSAALVAVSAVAAPLARKATARGSAPLAAREFTPISGAGLSVMKNVKSAGRVAALRDGIRVDLGGTEARRNRAALSAHAAARALPATINLRGSLLHADSWGTKAAYGLYSIPTTSDGTFDQLLKTDAPLEYGVVDNGEGKLAAGFVEDYGFMQLTGVTVYSTETWRSLSETFGNDHTCLAAQAALDPVSGKVYGYFFSADGKSFNWAVADFAGKKSTAIAAVTHDVVALGVDKNGQYYAVDASGKLLKIEKTTGAVTEIGDTGIKTEYQAGGCVYDKNGTFLYAVCTSTGSSLYEIDLATAAATHVTDFADGQQVTALYVVKPLAEDKAPAAPLLEVSCSGGSMDVELKITMPETLYDGTPAAGQTFGYTVVADGAEVVSGTAAAGETVLRTATMPASGNIEFLASASNADGASPQTKASCYVGKGTPAAPAGVTLTWADGTATLTWKAVTTASDGGYIDPAGITYTVLDADGTEASAEPLTATTWSCEVAAPVDEFKSVSFSVKANYEGKSSKATASNLVALGNYTAPMSMSLTGSTSKEMFGQHVVIDSNGDGKTWKYIVGEVRYSYASKTGDDWLISPAVKLEAGKAYPFKAVVTAGGDYYTERIEIKAGRGNTAEAMTLDVVGSTGVKGTAPTELTGMIVPDATGLYNIGFHAISDPDMMKLVLTGYEVGEPMTAAAPLAPGGIAVTPDFDGALKADIELTAPKNSIAGAPLQGKVTVDIFRSGTEEAVKSYTVSPGTKLSFADNVPASGNYTYTFAASNEAGAGLSASASAFIGPRKPANVDADAAVIKVTGPNTLQVDWLPVTTDVDGQPIAPEGVTYNLYSLYLDDEGYLNLGTRLNQAPIAGTTFTANVELPVEQDFYYIGLQAVNVDVAGDPVAASTIVGTPYELPVAYTDRESLNSYFFYFGSTAVKAQGSVGLGSMDALGIPGVDDDSYFAVAHNRYATAGTVTYFSTGLINVSGDAPELTYYEYRIVGEKENMNETEVYAYCDGTPTKLTSYTCSSLTSEGWNKVTVDLSAFKGKTVRFQFNAILRTHLYNLYDVIEVRDVLANDLSAAISAPAKAETDKEFAVSVTVTNLGSAAAPATSVSLLRDGQTVGTLPVEALESGAAATLTFLQTLGRHADKAEYAAEVIYPADMDASNNISETVTVERVKSVLPAVLNLSGEKTLEGNSLTWDAVDPATFPADASTEDFENGIAWEHSHQGWTFVDLDGAAVGGIQETVIPGITPETTKASFFLFDSSAEGFNATFAARSGVKYLASLFRADDGKVDDWAISPELNGEAQTVTFWASSYSGAYKETIEILYSTTDTDPENFISVVDKQQVPSSWTEFSAELPAGAKYFAIRSCATGSFMLMVDDVTFVAAGAVSTLQHTGYNIYRDGVKLNDAPLTANNFVDTDADDADHTYHVTAVYDRGESELSNAVTLEQSGIAAVAAASAKVAVEGSDIVVSGADGLPVSVVAADGKVLHSAAGDARVTASHGVYLVTVGRKTVKVAVK